MVLDGKIIRCIGIRPNTDIDSTEFGRRGVGIPRAGERALKFIRDPDSLTGHRSSRVAPGLPAELPLSTALIPYQVDRLRTGLIAADPSRHSGLGVDVWSVRPRCVPKIEFRTVGRQTSVCERVTRCTCTSVESAER